MTLDFSSGIGTLYFYRTKPDGIKPHVKLRSKYNNKLLKVNSASPVHELLLTNFQSGTGWFSGDWTSSYNRTLDVAGYYYLEFYTDDTLRFTELVKVVNSAGIDTTPYISTNETNEQTVYFR